MVASTSRFLHLASTLAFVAACGGPSPAPPAVPDGAPKTSSSTPPLPAPGATPASVPPRPADEPAPPVFPADRKPRLLAALPDVERLLTKEFPKLGAPALAAGVVIDGELVWSKGFGARTAGKAERVDADTVFRIGSITKTFTATAAQKLVEQGKLDLDADASKYLPELAGVVYPTTDSARITMRHLLTHSSGLPRLGPLPYTNPDQVPTEKEFLDSIQGLPLNRPTDAKVVYSNLAFGLAGIVIGHIAGVPYRDFVTAEIFRPLEMTSTVWDESAVPAGKLAAGYALENGTLKKQRHWRLGPIESAGGIYSSIRDMSRYAAFHLDAWPARSAPEGPVLRRSSVRVTHMPARSQGFSTSAEPNAGALYSVSSRAIGLGWQLLDTCELEHVVWHNGGTEGYSSALYLMPEHGVAVVLLASADAGIDRVAREVLDTLHATGALVLRREQPSERLLAKMQALTKLLAKWDRAAFDSQFEPSFREQVTPAIFEKSIQDIRAQHGACRFDRVTSVKGRDEGRFELACDKGRLDVGITLGGKLDAGIVGSNVRSLGLPAPPKTVALAEKLVAAMPTFGPKTCQELLSPKFNCRDLIELFEGVRADVGKCKLGKTIDGDGEQQGVFDLDCERGHLVLTVGTTSGDPPKIGLLYVKSPEDPSVSDDRCSG